MHTRVRAHVWAVFSLHCGFQGRNSNSKACMASALSAQLFEGYTFLRQGLMLDTSPQVVKNDLELLILLPLSQVLIIDVWLTCSNLCPFDTLLLISDSDMIPLKNYSDTLTLPSTLFKAWAF